MQHADISRRLQAIENETAAAVRRPVPALSREGYCHDCAQSYERSKR
jgi:hypothetical protein